MLKIFIFFKIFKYYFDIYLKSSIKLTNNDASLFMKHIGEDVIALIAYLKGFYFIYTLKNVSVI